MGLDGGDAHVQRGGDLRVRAALPHREGHLALAVAEGSQPLAGPLLAKAAAELDAREAGDGGYVATAEPEAVGHAALTGGVVLTHLAPSDGAGLEQLFFDLTTGAPEALPADLVEATR